MRCYLRPIFDGSHSIDPELDQDGKPALDNNDVPRYVAAYERDSTIWNLQGRNNPWHSKLDEVMFYL